MAVRRSASLLAFFPDKDAVGSGPCSLREQCCQRQFHKTLSFANSQADAQEIQADMCRNHRAFRIAAEKLKQKLEESRRGVGGESVSMQVFVLLMSTFDIQKSGDITFPGSSDASLKEVLVDLQRALTSDDQMIVVVDAELSPPYLLPGKKLLSTLRAALREGCDATDTYVTYVLAPTSSKKTVSDLVFGGAKQPFNEDENDDSDDDDEKEELEELNRLFHPCNAFFTEILLSNWLRLWEEMAASSFKFSADEVETKIKSYVDADLETALRARYRHLLVGQHVTPALGKLSLETEAFCPHFPPIPPHVKEAMAQQVYFPRSAALRHLPADIVMNPPVASSKPESRTESHSVVTVSVVTQTDVQHPQSEGGMATKPEIPTVPHTTVTHSTVPHSTLAHSKAPDTLLLGAHEPIVDRQGRAPFLHWVTAIHRCNKHLLINGAFVMSKGDNAWRSCAWGPPLEPGITVVVKLTHPNTLSRSFVGVVPADAVERVVRDNTFVGTFGLGTRDDYARCNCKDVLPLYGHKYPAVSAPEVEVGVSVNFDAQHVKFAVKGVSGEDTTTYFQYDRKDPLLAKGCYIAVSLQGGSRAEIIPATPIIDDHL